MSSPSYPASPCVTQRDFMEQVLGFEADENNVGDDLEMVRWHGHGLALTVPTKWGDRSTLIKAVINAAKKEGSRARASAIREALGMTRE